MKKLICSLLTLSLALLVLTTSYAQEDTDIETLRAADVNADGMINILDLVLIASHFGETSTADQAPELQMSTVMVMSISLTWSLSRATLAKLSSHLWRS